ncbi:hypothetical protein [Arthrobacter globiformis]|uniref:Uncharacterized protein n=1 Tax=Arthrobacter globiformis TaxID=1665 RepID=A0A328HHY3_ARTGO|nr:hypothetical protein [Arthrobacter globiformis]RAM38216.1 hypothetical protein DBZ45_06935 [Arthrobacter globiformis]
MARAGTEAYFELYGKVEEAKPVVEHDSFSTRFDSPVVAEMVREVFYVLHTFLNEHSIQEVDADLAMNGGAHIDGEYAWFVGSGALYTAQSLEGITGLAYRQVKAPAQVASDFRKNVELLTAQVGDFLDRIGGTAATRAAVQLAVTALNDLRRREVTRLLEDVEGVVEQIQEQKKKAEASATAASDAAGITGDAALSSYYSELAAEEKQAANTFRKLTVVMAFAGAGATGIFLAGHSFGLVWLDVAQGDYVHLIQRAVFVGGVFGLAGYFARQAHQHRSMANWASALAVQLMTFDAYLRAVDSSEVKDDLRRSFAARVFGEHPAMKGEPVPTPSAAAMDTAVDWAAKLMPGGK